jgi:hypothetical protein
MDTMGFEGQMSTFWAEARLSRTSGAGSHGVAPPHEVVLEADLHRSPGVRAGNHQTCLHSAVAHGKDPHAHVPGAGYLVGDLRQGGVLDQPLGPVEVGGQVMIPEPEPSLPCGGLGRSHVGVAVERVHGVPRLTGQAPSPFGIDGLGQGVGDGVDVRADVEAMEHHVIGGVHHSGDLGRSENTGEPSQHAGSPHAAGEGGQGPVPQHGVTLATTVRRRHGRRLRAT